MILKGRSEAMTENIGHMHYWPPPDNWDVCVLTMYFRLPDGTFMHGTPDRITSGTPDGCGARNNAVLAFWWEERERPLFEAMIQNGGFPG